MILTRKISPKGIDINVDAIQVHLNSLISWTNFNSYPRIYKEETEQGIKPMNYTSNGDYVDVFTNDNLNGSIFFYNEDTRNAVNGYFNDVTLSMVVQLDLDALYPNVTHRPDEEAHNDIIIALKKLMPTVTINALITGLNNVYSEFSTTQVQLDDISKFHVFRIDMSVVVDNDCN